MRLSPPRGLLDELSGLMSFGVARGAGGYGAHIPISHYRVVCRHTSRSLPITKNHAAVFSG